MKIATPTIAAITLDQTGGGVAAVSRLFWRVIAERWGRQAQLVTMFEHPSLPATLREKVRYTMAMASAQAFGRTDWILFTHLGLAKIQTSVPKLFRRPYAVFLHGIEAWKPLSANERDALAGAQLRVANSRYTAERVKAAHPDIGEVAVCPLALPAQDPNAAETRLQPYGPHAVLTVARMSRSERYKGHDQLIDSWPRVVAAVPDAQLIIAGDGDDADRLKAKAAGSDAAGRIQFTGFVSARELDDLYRSAALFSMPSRSEGFGLVYLEAMARRLPCIGSIHDAAGEVIVDGVTGQLVDQDDTACLAGTIVALLLDDDRRRRMGDAGHARLLSEFTFDRFAERVHACLDVETTRLGAAV
jgi:phosphatidylinositol alpha-1,6-mannosyltransferase